MSMSTADMPPGEAADFAYQAQHLDQDNGYQLIITTVIWAAMALATVVAKLWSRKIQKVGIGADDWLSVAAMFFGIGMSIVTCLMAHYGVGRHVLSLPPGAAVEIGKASFAFELLYVPTLGLAKLSILAMYRRIFMKVSPWFSISVWALIAYTILWIIGLFLSILLECHPISSLWTNNCFPPDSTTIATNVLNIISDLAIFLLPQPLIWSLQMDRSRKLGVSLVLCLGLFATIISIIRIPLIIVTGSNYPYDVTYHLIITDILTIIEPLTLIICSCLPVTRVIWQKALPMSMGLDTLRSILRRGRRGSPSEIELGNAGGTWSEITDNRTKVSLGQSSEVMNDSSHKSSHNGSFDNYHTRAMSNKGINVATRIEVSSERIPGKDTLIHSNS